jgi:hypothetical protein
MIGFGMSNMSSLAENYRYLFDNYLCYLVLCSKEYTIPPKKYPIIGIRLSFDGMTIGSHLVYYHQVYDKVSPDDHGAKILCTLNNHVTNQQIEETEYTTLIPITTALTKFTLNSVRYKVIYPHSVVSTVIYPLTFIGQSPPRNMSPSAVHAATMYSIGGNALRRALGPHCLLINIKTPLVTTE